MSFQAVLRPNVISRLRPLVSKGHTHPHAKSYHRSVVPYIMREMMRDLERPTLYDQHFGLGMTPSRLLDHDFPFTPLLAGYLRPWRLSDVEESGTSNIVNNKDCFKVSLDVQQFKPSELSVKLVDDFLVVEGKHEERSDEHGLVSRQFSRRYQLPSDIDVQTLQSSLSSDGVLTLMANKKPESENTRSIPITQTNQPAGKPLAEEATQEGKQKEAVKKEVQN